MEEGMILVELDELLDPRLSATTGKNYHYLSVRREGSGTAEMYISESIYNKIKALRLARGAMMFLQFALNKYKGQFEARLVDVQAA